MFFQPFLYAFGLFQHNIEQIKELHDDIHSFFTSKKEAIFVLFLGVVNHWITLVVHKSPQGQLSFYLLDSSNQVFLDKTDQQLPDIVEQATRRKEALGLKRNAPFTMKMSVQGLFDMRSAFELIVDVFEGHSTITQHYYTA